MSIRTVIFTLALTVTLAACTKSDSSEAETSVGSGSGSGNDVQDAHDVQGEQGVPSVQTAQGSWPEFSKAPLAGKVLGRDWAAQMAILRASPSDNKLRTLDLYGETFSGACETIYPTQEPIASVQLPASYAVKKYITDMNKPADDMKYPLSFSIFQPHSTTVVAERTKVAINAITASGFSASVYAKGTTKTGETAEINGQVNVIDCSKISSFDVWTDMVGNYSLKSYDNGKEDSRYMYVTAANSIIYDFKAKKYLRSVEFPLLFSVKPNSESAYNFGPIEGLGVTTMEVYGDVRTYFYKYDGPVNYQGRNIELHLRISAAIRADSLDIAYSLEVPGHIELTEHRFQLAR